MERSEVLGSLKERMVAWVPFQTDPSNIQFANPSFKKKLKVLVVAVSVAGLTSSQCKANTAS